jgi:hypothetical protein
MTVGAPGAGIGGLFYLASAIVLPLRAGLRAVRGEPVAWGPVARQWLLAVSVVVAIWFAGWLIGLWAGPELVRAGGKGVAAAIMRSTGIMAGALLYASVATLTLVLLLVQIAAFVVGARSITVADRRKLGT